MFIAKRCFLLSDSQLLCATANAYPIWISIYPIHTGGCTGSYCRIPPPQKTEMRPMPYLKLVTMIDSTSLCISIRKLFFKYSVSSETCFLHTTFKYYYGTKLYTHKVDLIYVSSQRKEEKKNQQPVSVRPNSKNLN